MWKLIHSDRSYGEVINLSRNQAVKIIDIVNYLIEESGKKIELISDKSDLGRMISQFTMEIILSY